MELFLAFYPSYLKTLIVRKKDKESYYKHKLGGNVFDEVGNIIGSINSDDPLNLDWFEGPRSHFSGQNRVWFGYCQSGLGEVFKKVPFNEAVKMPNLSFRN